MPSKRQALRVANDCRDDLTLAVIAEGQSALLKVLPEDVGQPLIRL
jgi:hypothetical protein